MKKKRILLFLIFLIFLGSCVSDWLYPWNTAYHFLLEIVFELEVLFSKPVRWEVVVDPDTMKMGQMIDRFYLWRGEDTLRFISKQTYVKVNGKKVFVEKFFRVFPLLSNPKQLLIYTGSSRLPLNMKRCTNLIAFHTDYGSDSLVEYLTFARKLRFLSISESNITDTGAKYVSLFNNLEELGLENCYLSDEGIKYLGSLEKLKELVLSKGSFTGSGFRYWPEQNNLEKLSILRSQITDEGLKVICSSPNVKHLVIFSDSITDEGLPNLEKLPKLTYCVIGGDQITDEGIRYLEKFMETR